jgi:anti-sigma28 factor (negative regulator of flagellin synthesis)
MLPIQELPPMVASHEKVSDIKEEIEQGSYSVDPKEVADAILRRLREQLLLAGTSRPCVPSNQ